MKDRAITHPSVFPALDLVALASSSWTTREELRVSASEGDHAPENLAASKLITPSENAGRGIRRTRYVILVCMDPLAPLRTVGGRFAPSAEALAQAIAERVIGLVVSALDLNALLAEVDLNAVLEQVDLGQVLDRVDVNQMLDQVDLDSLLARVDIQGILNQVDVNSLLDRVDVNRLLDRVDVNRLLTTVDVNRLLSTVDVTALIGRVDVGQILQQVDVNEVIGKVDLDAVIDRVDMNAVVQRIDLEALVEQTDLGSIIARSSGGVASDLVDAVRSRTVGIDESIARWVARLRRRPYSGPPGPPAGLPAAAAS
jgi:hypothetical protein